MVKVEKQKQKDIVGTVLIKAKLPSYMRNGHGTGHGGIIATLHDSSQWYSILALTGKECMTAKLTVEFIQVVPLEQEVEIHVRVVRASKNFAFTDGEIRDAKTKKILSKGSCVFLVIPEGSPKL